VAVNPGFFEEWKKTESLGEFDKVLTKIKVELENSIMDETAISYPEGELEPSEKIESSEADADCVNSILDREDKSTITIVNLISDWVDPSSYKPIRRRPKKEQNLNRLIEELWQSLAKDNTIKHLNIYDECGLDLDILAQSLSVNRTLKTLCVGGKHLSGPDIKSLAEGLEGNKELLELEIFTRRAEDDCIIDVCEGVRHHPKLKILRLEIRTAEIEDLVSAINKLVGNTVLKQVEIDIDQEIEEDDIRNIIMALKQTSILSLIIKSSIDTDIGLDGWYWGEINDGDSKIILTKKQELICELHMSFKEKLAFLSKNYDKDYSILLLKNILDYKAYDINALYEGQSFLHNAIHFRNQEAIEYLIANGADFFKKNSDGKSSIDLAHDEDDRDLLELMHKNIFFRSPKMKRSEIDNSRYSNEDNWVISIARLPDTSTPEHAFLILEGVEFGKAITYFMDFVRDDNNPRDSRQHVPRLQGRGKVRIYNFDGEIDDDIVNKCAIRMMDVKNNQKIIFMSWNITRDQANSIIYEAKKDKNNPPLFHLLGQGNITVSSSSSEDGYNCFSWARKKLLDLNEPVIIERMQPDTIDRWVLAATHRYLPDSRYSFWSSRTGVAVAAAVISTAAVLGKVAYDNSDSFKCKIM